MCMRHVHVRVREHVHVLHECGLLPLLCPTGNPCALMAKLSGASNPYNLAVDWDGIRESVLDMATYCCSAMATQR